ncbi:MAG: AbrB family transcriptional regulator [Caulobacteraceae bacterium]|nr:AbrB family transcriptional regulator [Caulobacteraceae bacterium]
MTIVSIRRQGGAAVMTIPAEILRTLRIDVGAKLEVAVGDGAFTARPEGKTERRRYSLRELLRGATPEAMRRLAEETDWAREGDAVGREL